MRHVLRKPGSPLGVRPDRVDVLPRVASVISRPDGRVERGQWSARCHGADTAVGLLPLTSHRVPTQARHHIGHTVRATACSPRWKGGLTESNSIHEHKENQS